MGDDWRAEYQPGINAVRSGQRPWASLEQLHRKSLEKLLLRHGLGHLGEAERKQLVLGWHFLGPWLDPVVRRLKQKYLIGTLSNGGVRLQL